MSNVTWTQDAIAEARRLWDEGNSAGEIARALSEQARVKITRNAVLGLAHRQNFPARPSPIGKRPDGSPPQPARPPVCRRERETCRFPLSDGAPWLFCEAATVPGAPAPYCAHHLRIAYVQPQPAEQEQEQAA